jgi:hypothetical protein
VLQKGLRDRRRSWRVVAANRSQSPAGVRRGQGVRPKVNVTYMLRCELRGATDLRRPRRDDVDPALVAHVSSLSAAEAPPVSQPGRRQGREG